MGGKETIRQLLEMDPQAVAIIASGYSRDPVMSRFRDYGFKDVIEKPFSNQRLSEALWRAVRGGRESAARQ
jgi:FixJ family two-component response regulator